MAKNGLNRTERGFWAVGIVLTLLAVSKILLVLSTEPQLNKPDPVFQFLSLRHTSFIAALIEIAGASVSFLLSDPGRRAIALIWITSIFIIYRSLLYIFDLPQLCSCLGILERQFGLSNRLSGIIGWSILITGFLFGIFVLKDRISTRLPKREDTTASKSRIPQLILSSILFFGTTAASTCIASAVGRSPMLLTGSISIGNFSASGRQISERSTDFTAHLNREKWQIVTVPRNQSFLNPAASAAFSRAEQEARAKTGFGSSDMSFVVGSDGVDTYSAFYLGQREQIGDVKVRKTPIPLNDGNSQITFVWAAAFAMQLAQSNKAKPLWPLGEQESIWQSNKEYVIEAHTNISGQISSIVQLDDGFKSSEPPISRGGQTKPKMSPQSSQSPFERLRLDFSQWIDSEGGQLPRRMRATTLVNVFNKAGDSRIATQSVVTVTILTANPSASLSDFRPQMHGLRPKVYDFRYTDATHPYVVSYIASNSTWVPYNDSSLKNELALAGRINATIHKRLKTQSTVNIVMLISFAIISTVCWHLWRNVKKTN
jgi:hypothetical protein